MRSLLVAKSRVKPGAVYGQLTVIGPCFKAAGNRRSPMVVCECTCGQVTAVFASNLCSGVTMSCGCRRIANRIKHGHSNHELATVHRNMKARCNNPNAKGYYRYGGRGISVCDEWREFVRFYEWAIANGWNRGLQLDRIDNDGDYSPENCRFVTRSQNSRNKCSNRRITLFGETRTLIEWLEDGRTGVGSQEAFWYRTKKLGMTPEEALLRPKRRNITYAKRVK